MRNIQNIYQYCDLFFICPLIKNIPKMKQNFLRNLCRRKLTGLLLVMQMFGYKICCIKQTPILPIPQLKLDNFFELVNRHFHEEPLYLSKLFKKKRDKDEKNI